MDPLDFDAFVVLLGYKTIELDPEEVILEALSKWDKNGTGFIDEELLEKQQKKYKKINNNFFSEFVTI